MAESKPVSIHIMGNEYHVASPEDEVEKLEQAARSLDKRMREIKDSGRIMGLERVAVMAALNLSYELMHGERTSLEETEEVNQRIKSLQQKVDLALASSAQSELI
ncbi:MAG: cell division protein ZapA [Kangiellaceae bacterium]|nr:cell division protein ZapA [Kangiellaceae bacterium]